ncbi:Crp/Fnr family transcriptional regulator [Chitinophaga sp. Cy-1792]|uniref:Crp/Fnr family transcriptional regulator n=1 Tax=Chitinophaga sp. Cy-1792 TaxID=2608339 RepID=UPI00141D7695|nr:Crp/Fnr family transcriptional regulator [Chitinophaga sp. Cy-1792]NIG55961.1 Crp/Fnr family transcriptional regulator [Chitinophaga sp. Cy-1792]
MQILKIRLHSFAGDHARHIITVIVKTTDHQHIISAFFAALRTYQELSPGTLAAMEKMVRIKEIPAGTLYLAAGAQPVFVSFIYQGLFSYYHPFENGDIVIKRFFPENSFVAATAALIAGQQSQFAIQALEDSIVVEFSFKEFKHLMLQHPDLAFFWINYLERNWVVEKEFNEVNYKVLPAKIRYQSFLEASPQLASRLQLQHIAAFLGVTPTQLSRIRASEKKK